MSDQSRKEECRSEALRFLVERVKLRHSAETVRRGVNRVGFDFTQEEIEDALTLLTGMGLAVGTPYELGSTLYYQATSAGVLAHERS